MGPNGTVYEVAGSGDLFPIAPDGSKKWQAKVGAPGAVTSPSLGKDAMVYTLGLDGKLYAVGADANVAWTFDYGSLAGSTSNQVDARPFSGGGDAKGAGDSPTIGPDGTIYFGASNANFYAVRLDGKLKWQFPIYGSVYAAPELAKDGRLYIAATVGHVWALDSKTGRPVWDWDAGTSVRAVSAITPNGQLLVGTRHGQLWLLGE